MIAGLLCLVLANAAILLGAHALWRRVACGVPSTDAVLFLVLRLMLVTATVLAAGLLHVLTPWGLGIPALAVLALLLARGEHRHLKRLVLPEVGWAPALLAVLVIARLLAQIWFFAPYPGDVLSYHLPKVAEWVRAGGFTREMGVDSHVTFPSGFEAVEAWWVVFLHHDVLIEMAGVEFLVLGCAAAYALARQIGLQERASFVAALLFGLTPVVHFQATACTNDMPAGSLILTTVALLHGGAPTSLALAAFGIGCGIKPIVAYAAPGLGLLFFLSRNQRIRESRNPFRWGIAVLGLAVGSFWYLRNWIWFGSPIYPVGPDAQLSPHSIQYGGSLSSLGRSLGDLVTTRIFDTASGYGPYTNNTVGWGLAAVALGLPCLAVMMWREPRMRGLALALTLCLLSVLTFVQYDPWSMRFISFFPVILSLATAWASAIWKPVGFLAGAVLLLQFAATTLPLEIPPSTFQELAGQSWQTRSLGPIYGIDVPDDTIGYFVDNRNKAYLLYRPDLSRRVVYIRASTSAEVRYQMEREGLRTVYASCVSQDGSRALRDLQRQGVLRDVANGIYVRSP